MLQLDKGYSRRKHRGLGSRGVFWNLTGRNKFEAKAKFPEPELSNFQSKVTSSFSVIDSQRC